MRIIITGGGTGGHIFPALEIAKAFINHDKSIRITYVGNKDSLEERLAQNVGLDFFGLKAKQLVGQSIAKKLFALASLIIAIFQSLGFLIKNRPHAAIGVGGYVSAPLIIACFILRIPRFIAEQNVVPGFANKALGTIANKVFISFAESAPYFKTKTVLTGNPIRPQFFNIEKKEILSPLKILISGGSLGALFLNEEVPKALAIIKKECPHFTVTHQTGQKKLLEVKQYYEQQQINAAVLSFIEDMPKAFNSHDLLISRAGATVIAEIMAAGMPAILVPYRHANGHQRANALALCEKEASRMVEEGEYFASVLANTIKEFYQHQENLMLMSQKAKALATPKASAHIVKEVLEYCS